MQEEFDSRMVTGLGTALPASANPSTDYTGKSFIKVLPVRTKVEKGEALTLNIIAMGVGTPTLKYRELGGSTWTSITASNVGRSVYSATIPAQTQDFEYYLESCSVAFPVTANSTSPIYQTVVAMAAETEPCEGLPPYAPTGVTASESN